MTSTVDQILEDIELEEWLDEHGVTYKGAGDNLKLRECPFCGDSRWRVYFSKRKKTGLCFHGDCNKHFNLFSFARQFLHLDSHSTIQHFEALGRTMGLRSHRPKLAPEPKIADGWELPTSIELPTPEGITHPFLTARRITTQTQALFGLRWCASGTFSRADFSRRIIIPVADLDGTIQSFQGRATWQVDEEAGEKRYLFPSGLPGTGRFLYGAHLALGCEHVVMGEGPFDVMAIHQALDHPDFRKLGAIGSFGLAIGGSDEGANDQLARFRELRRNALRRVTIMWDGEAGAFKAALAAGQLLRRQSIDVWIATLPQGKDPNEVDTATVRRAIENAVQLTPQSFFRLRCAPPYK